MNHIGFNGVNTININNSAPIFAGDHGIYTHVDIYNKVDPSMVVTQNNTAPINVASAAIYHNITVGAGAGGDATAGVIVTNSGALTSSAAEGIYIKTNANTDGGYAHAYNQTTNSGPIVSHDDSIYSHATADTNYFGGPGSATGGTSIATVYIENQAGGTLSSTNGEGIDGVARATADGNAYHATGGVASAATTIINSAPINSWWDGIKGGAVADARGFGSYSILRPPETAPASAAPRSRAL